MKRKALFVGICDYGETGAPSLPWTANDARELSQFFEKRLGCEKQCMADMPADELKKVLHVLYSRYTSRYQVQPWAVSCKLLWRCKGYETCC